MIVAIFINICSPDNPLGTGIGSMTVTVVELVEPMHPVCAIIGNGV